MPVGRVLVAVVVLLGGVGRTPTVVYALQPPSGNIAGRWNATFTGPTAEQPKTFAEAVFDLKIEGKTLTGTAQMGNWPGLCPISEGVIDGDHFSFVAIGSGWSTSGYPRLTFEGTIRGDDMMLTLTWGYVGSAPGRKLKMEGKRIRIDR